MQYGARDDVQTTTEFVSDADVVGLYQPDVAAVASRQTACDPGSGPTRIDD